MAAADVAVVVAVGAAAAVATAVAAAAAPAATPGRTPGRTGGAMGLKPRAARWRKRCRAAIRSCMVGTRGRTADAGAGRLAGLGCFSPSRGRGAVRLGVSLRALLLSLLLPPDNLP